MVPPYAGYGVVLGHQLSTQHSNDVIEQLDPIRKHGTTTRPSAKVEEVISQGRGSLDGQPGNQSQGGSASSAYQTQGGIGTSTPNLRAPLLQRPACRHQSLKLFQRGPRYYRRP